MSFVEENDRLRESITRLEARAERAEGERDRARGTAATLEAELAHVITETGWRDCVSKQGTCDTRCGECGCCEHDWRDGCTCKAGSCGCKFDGVGEALAEATS